MKHGISDDLYVSIYEGIIKAGRGADVVLSQTLNEIRNLGLFSVEALELLRDTINAGLSSRQHIHLKNSLKARDEEKVRRACRYISLCADGAPTVVQLAFITNIANLVESGMADGLASGAEGRLGAAHGLLALRNSQPASGGESTSSLIELYPDMIRLFAEYPDRVLDVHEFIAQRRLKLKAAEDLTLIREFLELKAPSLSAGAL